MTTSGATPPTVAETAARLVSDYLDRTAAHTHRRLGAVVGVAVTTGASDEPHTVGASTPLAAEVDRLQIEIGVGPCLETLRTGGGFVVDDLAADERWRPYGPQAAAMGAACCVSVPVEVDGATVAVFKAYGDRVGGLDAVQLDLAARIGAELAGGIALARHLSGLAVELDDLTAMAVHRRAIDLALGIMMQRAQVDAETAFSLLRAQSQQRNVKLRDVAAEVVASVPGAGPIDLVPPYNPRG